MIMFFNDVGDVRKRWVKSRNKRYTRRFVHVFSCKASLRGMLAARSTCLVTKFRNIKLTEPLSRGALHYVGTMKETLLGSEGDFLKLGIVFTFPSPFTFSFV